METKLLLSAIQLSLFVFNGLILISTLFMCKKKKAEGPAQSSGGQNQPNGVAGSSTRPTPPAAESGLPTKSPKADSLAARKPEIKVAKRNDEIVQHGPVSKKRGDYKTMNITSVNFDDSLTEQEKHPADKK